MRIKAILINIGVRAVRDDFPTRIGIPQRVAIPILIGMQRVGLAGEARKGISGEKRTTGGIIPPRANTPVLDDVVPP
jgi:hypothetical protein